MGIVFFRGGQESHGVELVRKQKLPNQFVITEQWGGLGDALAYSTLPEAFFHHYGRETYISNFYSPRNAEIARLVWGCNPYVVGWSSQAPNAGSVVEYKWLESQTFIENVESSHGLPAINTRPKIYYQPTRNPGLRNKFLIDISATTLSRGPFYLSSEVLERKVSELIESYDARNVAFIGHANLRKIDKHSLGLTMPLEQKFPSIERIPIHSLFEFADALSSARGMIGLHSGAVALAAAIRDFNADLDIECLVTPSLAVHPRQIVEKIHNYPDVRYTPIT